MVSIWRPDGASRDGRRVTRPGGSISSKDCQFRWSSVAGSRLGRIPEAVANSWIDEAKRYLADDKRDFFDN